MTKPPDPTMGLVMVQILVSSKSYADNDASWAVTRTLLDITGLRDGANRIDGEVEVAFLGTEETVQY